MLSHTPKVSTKLDGQCRSPLKQQHYTWIILGDASSLLVAVLSRGLLDVSSSTLTLRIWLHLRFSNAISLPKYITPLFYIFAFLLQSFLHSTFRTLSISSQSLKSLLAGLIKFIQPRSVDGEVRFELQTEKWILCHTASHRNVTQNSCSKLSTQSKQLVKPMELKTNGTNKSLEWHTQFTIGSRLLQKINSPKFFLPAVIIHVLHTFQAACFKPNSLHPHLAPSIILYSRQLQNCIQAWVSPGKAHQKSSASWSALDWHQTGLIPNGSSPFDTIPIRRRK